MTNLNIDNQVVFRVALAIPLHRNFDYLGPDNIDTAHIKPGVRVVVPFGKHKKIGILIQCTQTSERDKATLKKIETILDSEPLLDTQDLKLLHWASQYYHHPLGEVMMMALPALLREGKAAQLSQEKYYSLTQLGITQNVAALHRAPKQKQLLQFFIKEAEIVSEKHLDIGQKNWRLPLKQLLLKKFIQLVKPPELSQITGHKILRGKAFKANKQQLEAIESVKRVLGRFQVFLLEGVTGSGKTEVYMQIIHQVLARNEQVLVLLPEITLTPQLTERFQQRFAVPVFVFHSKLTHTKRLNSWLSMQQGQGKILLGTRSALFTPLIKPGLIILDEEHDSSFKQQEGFRYSARDVAILRCKMLNIPIVMGSATPSLESLHNVEKKNYQWLHLSERAGKALEPELKILDIRNKKLQEGMAEPLIAEIKKTLAKQDQVLIFLNRRGYAPVLMCHSCGWIARCQRCDANLVVHYEVNKLRCHHCGQAHPLLAQCLSCKTGQLIPIGLGTERIEKAMQVLFPDYKSIRLDRDTTQKKGQLEKQLDAISSGKVDIILGTQMLAKGHDFPNVTLVAMLDVDSGLFGIDYHAPEKLAQLIVQVAGRAGRAKKPGKVILQTRRPDHPLLLTLIYRGYRDFTSSALEERRAAQLPPFSYHALLRVLAVDKQAPLDFLQKVTNLISTANHSTKVLGPVPAPMLKRAGRYRYQLLLQSARRQDLHKVLDEIIPRIEVMKLAKKVRWSLDVDPVDLY